ncbi:HlyD family efflux transporter periplasmic adaptor subunit [Pleurocapsa sp. PCC 7319]|uniref:HlyD family efflux transporter periplasmic adaptor subunit n=1 Tax=Pleurocapsa sp. PCC 7319 TaxID=118161 RepID=UPI0003450259|nr:HlyD family efflux transporter periplasmic adaptor subunit [Pleurocapsa sp. PCC 7319]
MSYSQPESALALANGRVRPKIRILIIDQQNLSSELLKCQLKLEPNMSIVATVSDELETFVAIQSYDPNVAIVDVDLPEIDGCALIKKISHNFPQIKIVIFTNNHQSDQINKALSLGAQGILYKNSYSEETKKVLNTINNISSRDTTPELFNRDNSVEPTTSSDNNHIDNNSAIVHSPGTVTFETVEEREDWSAATKDLLDSLPRVWTRGLLYFLIIGTGIILPWSILTKVDQTGTARGRLEPKDKVIHLDAPVAGKIEAITVKEGDKVKKGAILAELASEIVNSELEELQDKRFGLQQRLSQLELMYNQARITLNTKEDENQARLLEKQSQLAQARQNLDTLKALYESQTGEKLAQIEQAKQEINSSIAARKEAELAMLGAQEKTRRYQAAYREGVIAQDRFLDVQQQAKENQERLAQASSTVEQAKSRLKEQQNSYQNLIKKSKAEIKQASLRFEEQKRSDQTLIASSKLEKLKTEEQLQELQSQITSLTSEIAQTNKQLQSRQFQLKQRELIAPIDGMVFHIPARGRGAVVQPGERMIEIAPQDSALVLRAQIPPADSGFLQQGMPVKIKFDAYPFQDYGVTEGTLISVSPDSKVTETPQGDRESYELEIELAQPYVWDEGKRITLTPGQTATAEIIIRQRRVIDFFIDPFKKLQQDGMKL